MKSLELQPIDAATIASVFDDTKRALESMKQVTCGVCGELKSTDDCPSIGVSDLPLQAMSRVLCGPSDLPSELRAQYRIQHPGLECMLLIIG